VYVSVYTNDSSASATLSSIRAHMHALQPSTPLVETAAVILWIRQHWTNPFHYDHYCCQGQMDKNCFRLAGSAGGHCCTVYKSDVPTSTTIILILLPLPLPLLLTTPLVTILTTSPTHSQWSNYGGARGGLAQLKDLADSAKHLFWEGSRVSVKGPWNWKMITHHL